MLESDFTLTDVLDRADSLFADREIVSARPDGSRHRYTYGDAADRIARLAGALDDLGVSSDARVGTLARNHHRHFELYFAPACAGRSLHMGNVRLPAADLAATIRDAGDEVLFVDPAFLERVEAVADDLDTVEQYVVLAESVPETTLDPVVAYEDLLAGQSPTYDWPTLDEERECGLCYTTGTTGRPKGVTYTHRALALHTMMNGHVDTYAIGARDTVCPVVPMFHVNAWGFPYAAAFAGADLVLPGAQTDPEPLADLLAGEGVTVAAGVPTVWRRLAAHLDETPAADLDPVERLVVGGASVPASLIRTYDDAHDVTVQQGWGMTETSPLGLLTPLDPEPGDGTPPRTTEGRPVPGISARVVDDDGERVARDGEAMGELQVRGPWVTDGYASRTREVESPLTDDGWLRTGDVATWNADGYVDVVDRTDDLINSGGEWISSIELEDELMAHAGVAEAAIVPVADETWGERPLAVVVPRDGDDPPGTDALDAHLRESFPSWWLPDRYVVRESIPLTTTGKFDKRALRERFEGTDAGGDDASEGDV
ncbi:fatty-acyl-CoA synthase [Halarchaeum rubridurum]|uniref:Fatty-acyl-CoA synthase n=1 Tax=Halarchaeum rubridurum TaxID=489911 RepID=A0A830FU40_9EURY|nr:long-chain fatty acid--CoA ligase [Halarchaeum rubridurum]MBP1954429.1 fatty-acyl-CoA synthase [Halarchaeum rubridurum]GGM60936.1 long-chain-fatty-acid--CoA ligase [Halarchaeum rubridurum]